MAICTIKTSPTQNSICRFSTIGNNRYPTIFRRDIGCTILRVNSM